MTGQDLTTPATNPAAGSTSASGPDAPPLIEVRNLVKSFDKEQILAVNGVSLSILSGEWLAIMGASGSGKSTLLQIIGTLDSPDSGEVLYEGVEFRRIGRLDRFRGANIGFVFQMHHLLPQLSLVDNVALPLVPLKVGVQERREVAAKALEQVGLGHRLKHAPSEISGGERQRAAIARAIVNRPKIVLADEPTGNVDSVTEAKILDLFERLRQEMGVTFVIVTHDAEVARRADRVLEMRDGRMLAQATMAGKESVGPCRD